MTDAVSRLNAALQGRYAIERELGEGGMATVYLADDLEAEAGGSELILVDNFFEELRERVAN